MVEATNKDNNTLISLNLEKNQISSIGVEYLIRSIKKMKNGLKIQELNLGNNSIGDESSINLVQILEKKSEVKNLNLQQCIIHTEALDELFSSFKYNRYFQKLDLSNNSFILAPEPPFTNFLSSNLRLIELNLNNCRIGNPAAIGLLVGLTKNNTLKILRLSQNELRDEICTFVSDCIASRFCQLRELDLSQNILTDNGGIVLAKSLEQNRRLTVLNLSGNQLRNESGQVFSKVLMINDRLQRLNLRFNFIKFYYLQMIDQQLYKNRLKSPVIDIPNNKQEIKTMKNQQEKIGKIWEKIEESKRKKILCQELLIQEQNQNDLYLEEEKEQTLRLSTHLESLVEKRRTAESKFDEMKEGNSYFRIKKEQEISFLEKNISVTKNSLPFMAQEIESIKNEIKKKKYDYKEEIKLQKKLLTEALGKMERTEQEMKEIQKNVNWSRREYESKLQKQEIQRLEEEEEQKRVNEDNTGKKKKLNKVKGNKLQ